MNPTTLDPVTSEATASFTNMRVSNATLTALAGMNISTPTPIQAAAIPTMLDGRDIIGQARTGSGKTLAFGIPAVESVDPRIRGVQAIVLTPTRELAIQVGTVLEALAKPRNLTVGLVYGGKALGPQRDMLRKGVHVVVGTPGRVLDLLNQGALWLDKVRFFVLDEADEMLDRGFAPDVERILARTTPDRQTALFSATLPDWVRKTADKHLVDPVTVTVDPNPEDAAPVEHVAYDVLDGDKMAALRDLLDHRGEGSVILFGRTKHGVKKLARQLQMAGYPVAALQGNLSQNARDQVMADFRSGAVPVLFATNVAARGIDVDDVTAVINVELPESPELLTHRIGRTGRMGRKGIAITLLGPEDGAKWRQLEKGLGRRIPRARWAGATAAYEGTPEEAQRAAEAPLTNPQPAASQPRGRRGATPGQERSQAPRAAQGQPRQHAPRQQAPARPQPVQVGTPATPISATAARRPAFRSAPPQEATLLSRTGEPVREVTPVANERGPRGRGAAAQGGRYKVECSECGQTAEVRFQPDPTRPVYCDSCFAKRSPRSRRPADALVRA